TADTPSTRSIALLTVSGHRAQCIFSTASVTVCSPAQIGPAMLQSASKLTHVNAFCIAISLLETATPEFRVRYHKSSSSYRLKRFFHAVAAHFWHRAAREGIGRQGRDRSLLRAVRSHARSAAHRGRSSSLYRGALEATDLHPPLPRARIRHGGNSRAS